VRFNENETVNALEVAQFFNNSFINYDHYFFDLELAMRAGEISNFRVAD